MNMARLIGPIVLIGIGFLLLINNFVADISFGRLFEDFWPMVLVLIGVGQIAGMTASQPGRRWGRLSSGVVMITLGMLFLLQRWTDVGFGSTWPLLLVVVGGLGLLRALVGPNFEGDATRFRGGFPR